MIITTTAGVCTHLLFDTKQPFAGFVTADGTPAFYCAHCLCERLEDVLRNEEMKPAEIAETITFEQCEHIEPSTGSCGRCFVGIAAMLTLISVKLKFKTGKSNAQVHKDLDEVIRILTKTYGRLSIDNIYGRDTRSQYCKHGVAR